MEPADVKVGPSLMEAKGAGPASSLAQVTLPPSELRDLRRFCVSMTLEYAGRTGADPVALAARVENYILNGYKATDDAKS